MTKPPILGYVGGSSTNEFTGPCARQRRKEAIMEERLYDLIFIARPATPEDEIKKVIAGIEHTCAEKGGKIEKTEHWGTR